MTCDEYHQLINTASSWWAKAQFSTGFILGWMSACITYIIVVTLIKLGVTTL